MVITLWILEGQGTADRYMYTVLCCLLLNISENGHAAYILIFVEMRRFEGGVPSNRPPAANQFAPMRKARVKDFMIQGGKKGPTSRSEKVPELNLQSQPPISSIKYISSQKNHMAPSRSRRKVSKQNFDFC